MYIYVTLKFHQQLKIENKRNRLLPILNFQMEKKSTHKNVYSMCDSGVHIHTFWIPMCTIELVQCAETILE